MNRNKWKTTLFGYVTAAIAIASPAVAHASWPGYALYPIKGFGANPTQVFGVNAHARAAGLALPGTNSQVFDGLLGGAGYASQMAQVPSGWTSVSFTGLNDSLYMVGSANISGHPTAVGSQFGGNIVNMTANVKYSYFSQVMGVNQAGNAVGYYNKEENTGVVAHMFRWNSQSSQRSADTPNLLPGGINEYGAIVANNLKPNNYYNQAELVVVQPNGTSKTYLAPGPYMFIYPSGISTYGGITTIGETVLQQLNASNTHFEGYAFNVGANQWQILDAPGNPFYETHAVAVDVWGKRIAGSTIDPNGTQSATVWEYVNGNWVASYVKDLMPVDSSWQYTMATGINTYGAISGFGKHYENGAWVPRGFVATPKLLIGVVFQEGPVYGGLKFNPAVSVNGTNPFDIDLNLATTSSLIHIPRDILMPALSSRQTFEMQTQGVDEPTRADITVMLGGLQSTKTILVSPAVISSMTLKGNSDDQGREMLIALLGNAGPAGGTVTLRTSDPSVTVPSTVNIPAGASKAQFHISQGRGAVKGQIVRIYGTYRGVSVSQTYTVH